MYQCGKQGFGGKFSEAQFSSMHMAEEIDSKDGEVVKRGWKLVTKSPPNSSTPRVSKVQCANFAKRVLN